MHVKVLPTPETPGRALTLHGLRASLGGMQASGTGGLGNDAAAEWLRFLLEHVDDVFYLDTAFELVSDADGRGDTARCQEAIAAAELVAAAGRKPRPDLDADTLAWVERHWTGLWQGRRKAALATVRALVESSALSDAWRGTADFEAWRADVGDLVERLS